MDRARRHACRGVRPLAPPAQVAWDYNKGQPQAIYKFDECGGDIIHNYAVPPIATFSATASYGTRYGTGGSNTS
jgi:hypothetical protein